MDGWIGPTIALSLVLIALCNLGVALVALMSLKEIRESSGAISKELAEARSELAPALDALKRMAEHGAGVADLAKDEVHEIINTTKRVRHDIEQGLKRTKRRLADFEAVVDVVQEEVEETALDFGATLRMARSGSGMIGQLSRLVRPKRRGLA